MLKIIKLILRYIIKELIPAFGLLCLLCAGNMSTFIIGVIITIISLYDYLVEKVGDDNE